MNKTYEFRGLVATSMLLVVTALAQGALADSSIYSAQKTRAAAREGIQHFSEEWRLKKSSQFTWAAAPLINFDRASFALPRRDGSRAGNEYVNMNHEKSYFYAIKFTTLIMGKSYVNIAFGLSANDSPEEVAIAWRDHLKYSFDEAVKVGPLGLAGQMDAEVPRVALISIPEVEVGNIKEGWSIRSESKGVPVIISYENGQLVQKLDLWKLNRTSAQAFAKPSEASAFNSSFKVKSDLSLESVTGGEFVFQQIYARGEGSTTPYPHLERAGWADKIEGTSKYWSVSRAYAEVHKSEGSSPMKVLLSTKVNRMQYGKSKTECGRWLSIN